MGAGSYTHITRASGLVLTSTIYNTDHQNHINNHNFDALDDYSANVAEMRATVDPGEVGTESLAIDGQGELARLRFLIKEITGNAQWYESPAAAFLTALLGDTTPQLGGPLDTNGQAINESEGTVVASAATTDIWATDGNTLHVTGTTTITSFGTAPRIGAWRKVIFDAALILTHGVDLILQGSANITTAANDFAFVYANTTTQFGVLYFKNDGTSVVSTFPEGHISGLILSNNTTDALKDIDTAPGETRDGDNTENMVLTSTLVKQLDVAWAVGTNAGGLDTGTVAASTWYHKWLIKRTDTGVVDVLYSLSATAPTMPANYDKKRRIGAVLTNGASNIIAFFQYDDNFYWDIPSSDYNADNPGNSAVTVTMTVPTGVIVLANFIWNHRDDSPTADTRSIVTSLKQTDTAPSSTNYTTELDLQTSRIPIVHANLWIETNTSAQLRVRAGGSAVGVVYQAIIKGWTDPRGRNV